VSRRQSEGRWFDPSIGAKFFHIDFAYSVRDLIARHSLSGLILKEQARRVSRCQLGRQSAGRVEVSELIRRRDC